MLRCALRTSIVKMLDREMAVTRGQNGGGLYP
jgi:hypothetical protein